MSVDDLIEQLKHKRVSLLDAFSAMVRFADMIEKEIDHLDRLVFILRESQKSKIDLDVTKAELNLPLINDIIKRSFN